MDERKRTVREWQREAYTLAVSKGFHGQGDPTAPLRVATRLALIHCEISEAVECVARGRTATYWQWPDGATTNHGLTNSLSSEQRTYAIRAFISERGKPEGLGIELADVFLRLADFAESLGLVLLECSPVALYQKLDSSNPEHVAAALNDLHVVVSDIDPSQPERSDLQVVHLGLVSIAYELGIDLYAMAEIKHAYNLTRPIMHGGKCL